MEIISEVSRCMQDILTDEADRIADETEFVQRQRKFTGSTFVQTLVFGWLSNPQASLDELVQAAADVGVQISVQGLDQRFNETAATFLKGVLQSSVGHMVSGEPSAIEILGRFSSVRLLDGSTVALPDELAEVWQGCN